MMFDELPAPPKRNLSFSEKQNRRLQFVIVINYFALGYNFIHKLVMPLFMMWTSELSGASSHHLDWWWLFHLVMALLLRRQRWDDGWLKGFTYLGFGGGFSQIYVSFLEFNWHIVSFWVTSLATVAVLANVLSISRYQWPKKIRAWGAFVAFLIGFVIQYILLGVTTDLLPDAVEKKTGSKKAIPTILSSTQTCGQRDFSIVVRKGQLQWPEIFAVDQVKVEDCGFSYGVAEFSPEKKMQLTNSSNHYVNVKLSQLRNKLWKGIQNLPIRPGDSLTIPTEILQQSPLLVFSDSDPTMGKVLLLSKPSHGFPELSSDFDGIVVFRRTGIEIIKDQKN